MYERMLAGEQYVADDPRIAEESLRARRLAHRINQTDPGEVDTLRALFTELLGEYGEGAEIRPPFHCDYGWQITFGAALVRELRPRGARRRAGDHRRRRPDRRPNVAAADRHPPARARARGGTSGSRPRPISIGDNVWLGGGAVVCPGVEPSAQDTVVGAGAVVTRDLPAGVVAAGVPARVVREL